MISPAADPTAPADAASAPADAASAPAGAPTAGDSRMPRVALVTGAGRRLGRAIALGLAHAGWDVAVHYGRSAADAADTVARIRALGRRAAAVQADLADETATLALIDAARDALGDVGCLVNSASRFEHDVPAGFGTAALEAHMRPNLAAPLLLARRLHASLGPEARGVVVNLLDQKLDNLNPDYFSYTLSKAALLAATRMMAIAFAPRLRVVAVSPGITLPAAGHSEAAFEAASRATPLGRGSRPQDIAAAVAFLADASAITGVNLVVDGGQHLMPLARDVIFLTGSPETGCTPT
jgi:hypothetical protein